MSLEIAPIMMLPISLATQLGNVTGKISLQGFGSVVTFPSISHLIFHVEELQ